MIGDLKKEQGLKVGIDHGTDERTVLFVQSARKGATFRALALQSALRRMGRAVSIDTCIKVAREGGSVCLEDFPKV